MEFPIPRYEGLGNQNGQKTSVKVWELGGCVGTKRLYRPNPDKPEKVPKMSKVN